MTGAGGGKPLHERISDTLAETIARGQYPAGALLPGEMELCARFKASRTTIRTALDTLRHRGLVSRRAGIGTRVEAPAASGQDGLHDAGPFRLIEAHRMTAAPAAAGFLGCAIGDRLQVLRGLTGPASAPVALTTHHVLAGEADLVQKISEVAGPFAACVEGWTGRRITALRRSIEAVALGAHDAGLLVQETGAPALSVWRWYTASDGGLVLASHDLAPAGRGTVRDTLRL